MAADNEIREMPRGHFRSIIRQIKTLSASKTEVFLTATETAMRRMRLKPDPSKVRKGVPKGSDQFNPQSFIRWTEKIGKTDKEAVKQLIVFHATAKARLEG